MNPSDFITISSALSKLRLRSCAVVGGGIIGLSVAEGLSRQGIPVAVFDPEHPLAASPAAAAQICLKSQRYGRDFHFELQCMGRRLLVPWLQALEQEAEEKLNYRVGSALETFSTPAACEKQLRRVLQPAGELERRGLPPQAITRLNECSLVYEDEVWIEARGLIALLKKVLQNRKCSFYKKEFEANEAACFDAVFVCAGAWSIEVCQRLGVQNLPLDSVTLTLGSTFLGGGAGWPFPFVMQENSYDKTCKAIFTPSVSSAFFQVSSTTWKCPFPYAPLHLNSLHEVNAQFWQRLYQAELAAPFLLQEKYDEARTGLRLGWGSQFIRFLDSPCGPLIVCAGVHKSGYALAPWFAHFFANREFL